MTFVPQPNSGQTLGQTRDQMRSNTNLLRDAIAVNHVDLNQSDVGKHKFVVMPVQVAAPTTLANEAATYSKSVGGKSQVFFIRDATAGTECALTAGDTSQAQFAVNSIGYQTNCDGGWTFLPGALYFQYGTRNAPGNGTATVTFPIPFPNACFSVVLTGMRNSSNVDQIYLVSKTATNFTYRTTTGGTGFSSFDWHAVGN